MLSNKFARNASKTKRQVRTFDPTVFFWLLDRYQDGSLSVPHLEIVCNKKGRVLIANRVTEKDLRNWLSAHGFAGRSAKIESLDLHAIKSPGWVQVFSFQIQVKRSSVDSTAGESSDDFKDRPWLHRCGVIYDDEREQTDATRIWMFEDEEAQATKLTEMSEGLIVRRHGETHTGFLVLIAIFFGLIGLVSLITWIFNNAN